jgi:hypothetical protein
MVTTCCFSGAPTAGHLAARMRTNGHFPTLFLRSLSNRDNETRQSYCDDSLGRAPECRISCLKSMEDLCAANGGWIRVALWDLLVAVLGSLL